MSDRAHRPRPGPRWRSSVALRTPRALVFTFAFPLILLVLFNSIFIKGGDETATLPNDLKLSAQAYFTAGIIAYAVALSTFTTLAVSLTTQRERGQLKRYRGTPMPPWTFIARPDPARHRAGAGDDGAAARDRRDRLRGPSSPARPSSPSSSTSRSARRRSARSASPSRAFTPTVDAASTIAPFTRRHPRLLLRRLDPGRPAPPLARNGRQASSPSTTSPLGLQSTLSPQRAASAWKAATSPSSAAGPWPAPGSPPAASAGSRRRGQG